MGKTIIQQARGHGSLTYRVRRKAFLHRIKYPTTSETQGEGVVLKLIHSGGHSAPIAKIKTGNIFFYNLASSKMYEGQKIKIGVKNNFEMGDIVTLENLPTKTYVYNIESNPNDGGKFIKTAGSSGFITKKEGDKIWIMMPSKKEKVFNSKCRASIGIIAGSGRNEKPIVKAGRMWFIKKTKNKLWPRTSAVKFNAIDHPFGSGRGKNLTHGRLGKIPRRNSPPGAKVGSLRARRTGKGKGGIK
ncbi:MAG TPA: 50S ribosomal protein L2 [Candidatus Paceibacterota bacterium]|nr:50S ribosomal protein L2 [Candidatus Paceibacterota bacterium]